MTLAVGTSIIGLPQPHVRTATTTVLLVKIKFVEKSLSSSAESHTTVLPPAKLIPQISKQKRLLLAVPDVTVRPDQVFSERQFNLNQPVPISKPLSATCRIPLSPADSTVFQEGVRRLKRSLLEIVGGSLSWRLFLGSSVAIFIGAVTLTFVGPASPTSQQMNSKSTRQESAVSSKPTEPTEAATDSKPIQLTVNTSETNSGQEPAEFDDPFVPENQVKPKYIHALHLATRNGVPEPGTIRQVSRRNSLKSRPAELAGTIEVTDDATPPPSLNPLRNYERSRPRDR
jgi:hypothetical protein